jgi:hypothetical protein
MKKSSSGLCLPRKWCFFNLKLLKNLVSSNKKISAILILNIDWANSLQIIKIKRMIMNFLLLKLIPQPKKQTVSLKHNLNNQMIKRISQSLTNYSWILLFPSNNHFIWKSSLISLTHLRPNPRNRTLKINKNAPKPKPNLNLRIEARNVFLIHLKILKNSNSKKVLQRIVFNNCF